MPLQTSLEVATSTKKTPGARLSEALNELAKLGTGTVWRSKTRESIDWTIVRMGRWHDKATAVLQQCLEQTYTEEQGAAQDKIIAWFLTKRTCLETAYMAGDIPRIDILQQVVSLFLLCTPFSEWKGSGRSDHETLLQTEIDIEVLWAHLVCQQ